MHGDLPTQRIRRELEEADADELTCGEHAAPHSHIGRIEYRTAVRHGPDEPLVGDDRAGDGDLCGGIRT
jgi:hypothetical protein